jgi:hypothetical protein
MSNIRKVNKAAKKGKARVQEVEEVQTVDRRGNVRFKMRPVQHAPVALPASKHTPSRNNKQTRLKSPSPVASGSRHV